MSTPQAILRDNPNDPAAIQSLFTQVQAAPTDPDLKRLLIDLSCDERLLPQTRGVVALFLTMAIRQDATCLDPRTLGLDPRTPAFTTIHRGLAHHIARAHAELDLLGRFQRDEMTPAASPKLIIALPKSGSSLLALALVNMLHLARTGTLPDNPFEGRLYPSWWKLGAAHDWDLRPELGADPLFSRCPGLVYKGHVTPDDRNLAVLATYPNTRYIINIRDPRDQIVASYCDKRRWKSRAGQHVGPTSPDDVRADLDDYMRSGALLEWLAFAAKWLHIRAERRSIVVTYESLMQAPIDVLDRLASHFEIDLTRTDMRTVFDRVSPVTDRVQGDDTSGYDHTIYPLGWTGRIGIHDAYFDEDLHNTFNEILEAFQICAPWSTHLLDHYPTLIQPAPHTTAS